MKRVVPAKKHAPRTPPPPETSVEAAPEIAELIDAEADEAAKVLEAVVQQVVERGVAVPYEKPVEPEPEPELPEESQIERFDRLHASPLDRTDELLKLLRDASRDTNAVDVAIEWRYARACRPLPLRSASSVTFSPSTPSTVVASSQRRSGGPGGASRVAQ